MGEKNPQTICIGGKRSVIYYVTQVESVSRNKIDNRASENVFETRQTYKQMTWRE